MSDFLDVGTDTVANSGRNTANTSGTWTSWASRSETLLRSAASGAGQATVTSAFEDYVSRWNPALKGMATRAETLGTNATSAANIVDNADGDAAGRLAQQRALGQEQGSQLNRPITAY